MSQVIPNEPRGPFKVDFSTYDYKDILPKLGEYLQHDQIINQEHRDKGRIEKMINQIATSLDSKALGLP